MGNKSSKNATQDLLNANDSNSSMKKLSLIWLNCSSIDLSPLINEFRENTNELSNVFDDPVDCYGFLRQSPPNKKFLLIIPNDDSPDYLVPLIHRYCQIAAIFIYYSSDDNPDDRRFEIYKTRIKWTSFNDLGKRIEYFQARWLRHCGLDSLSIDVFKSKNTQDLSSLNINGTFLFFQLLIDTLLQMKCEPTDMNEFIELCVQIFKEKKSLNDLQNFSNDYKTEDAVKWYTKDTFLFSTLNEALRKQNLELLFLLRFFIRDLHHVLKTNQWQSSLTVYRGQLISKEEIQLLKDSIGDYISMKSFLSTSIKKDKAEFYIGNATLSSSNLVPVLFQITVESDLNGSVKRSFANITQLSDFGDDEEEVLFMAGSVYRVIDVYEEDNRYILSLQLSSVIQEEMQILLDYLKANRTIPIDSNSSLIAFVDVLHDLDEINLLEIFAQRALKEISHKMDSVNVMDIAKCHVYLGNIARNRNQFDEALKQLNMALTYIHCMAEPDSKALGAIYMAMAANFHLKHRNNDALDYYNRAIDILLEDEHENASKLAILYTNLGQFYRQRKNYEQARSCHEKALVLREKYLPKMHYDLARTYKGLAAIYFDLHQYDEALMNCQKALDIESKSLPLNHPTIAVTYEYMTVISEQAGHLECTKDFMAKANAIDHRSTMMPHSRFGCTMYTCPWCNHYVWVYNAFRFVKGAPCFRCLVRKIGIRR